MYCVGSPCENSLWDWRGCAVRTKCITMWPFFFHASEQHRLRQLPAQWGEERSGGGGGQPAPADPPLQLHVRLQPDQPVSWPHVKARPPLPSGSAQKKNYWVWFVLFMIWSLKAQMENNNVFYFASLNFENPTVRRQLYICMSIQWMK